MHKEKEWSDNYKIHLSGFTLDAAEKYKKNANEIIFFQNRKWACVLRINKKHATCWKNKSSVFFKWKKNFFASASRLVDIKNQRENVVCDS